MHGDCKSRTVPLRMRAEKAQCCGTSLSEAQDAAFRMAHRLRYSSVTTSGHPIITMIQMYFVVFHLSFELLASVALFVQTNESSPQDADDGVSGSSRVAALCFIDISGLS